jgi:hypothetical protein
MLYTLRNIVLKQLEGTCEKILILPVRSFLQEKAVSINAYGFFSSDGLPSVLKGVN